MVISNDEEVPVLEEDPVLVEDFTEEDEKKWIASPAPASAFAPAPALVPAPAPEPLLEEAV